jgi:hypothetical protein
MRQYIKDFSIYNLEEESTVIFKNAYHAFLNEKLSEVETMAMEQAYEYFSAHVKMNRSKVPLSICRNGSPSSTRSSSTTPPSSCVRKWATS